MTDREQAQHGAQLDRAMCEIAARHWLHPARRPFGANPPDAERWQLERRARKLFLGAARKPDEAGIDIFHDGLFGLGLGVLDRVEFFGGGDPGASTGILARAYDVLTSPDGKRVEANHYFDGIFSNRWRWLVVQLGLVAFKNGWAICLAESVGFQKDWMPAVIPRSLDKIDADRFVPMGSFGLPHINKFSDLDLRLMDYMGAERLRFVLLVDLMDIGDVVVGAAADGDESDPLLQSPEPSRSFTADRPDDECAASMDGHPDGEGECAAGISDGVTPEAAAVLPVAPSMGGPKSSAARRAYKTAKDAVVAMANEHPDRLVIKNDFVVGFSGKHGAVWLSGRSALSAWNDLPARSRLESGRRSAADLARSFSADEIAACVRAALS